MALLSPFDVYYACSSQKRVKIMKRILFDSTKKEMDKNTHHPVSLFSVL